MKPQSKVTIFMVVMIVMLSIYYFALPDKNPGNTNDNPDTTNPVVRSEEFATMRTQLRDSRETVLDQLETRLVSNISAEEKNKVWEDINVINTLTQNEMILETKIMGLGYNDAFVSATTNTVNVSILGDEHSVEKANEIIVMAKTQFGTNTTVTVTYVSLGVN